MTMKTVEAAKILLLKSLNRPISVKYDLKSFHEASENPDVNNFYVR